MLQLRQTKPIASGKHRLLFQHPDDAARLVKVIRPEIVDLRGRDGPWYRRLARTGPYRGFAREFNEYLVYRYASKDLSPLACVTGLVDTDMGLGLVVEKICAADGGLAMDLEAWVRRDGVTA